MGNMLRRFGVVALWLGLAVGAGAQAITITEPSVPLLPASFGEWKTAAAGAVVPEATVSLANANKSALEECGPQRSQVANYSRGGKTIHVEAVQFADRTGAVSAFTLMERPGMREGKEIGSIDAVGEGAVLVTVGSSLVLVNGAGAADVESLKPLVLGLPKVPGNKGVAPLLPSLVPLKGLVNGSVRYAVGPESYSAEDGVLPAQSLMWDKSGEAVTAQYADKQKKETLTILLYPTPMLAGMMTRKIQDALPQMGPQFAGGQVRREGELVALATGGFPPDAAKQLVGSVHLQQMVSIDKDVQPTFHMQAVQTYSMLTSILVLTGVLMAAAVLLGLFLGGGRALIRVSLGKPAAKEIEFLSLHLAPQNKAAEFHHPETPDRT